MKTHIEELELRLQPKHLCLSFLLSPTKITVNEFKEKYNGKKDNRKESISKWKISAIFWENESR